MARVSAHGTSGKLWRTGCKPEVKAKNQWRRWGERILREPARAAPGAVIHRFRDSGAAKDAVREARSRRPFDGLGRALPEILGSARRRVSRFRPRSRPPLTGRV